jgi:hypothetical protein
MIGPLSWSSSSAEGKSGFPVLADDRLRIGGEASGDLAEEECEIEPVFDVEFAENGTQVRLDRTLRYIELSCDHLVVAAEVYHARNL